MTDEQRYTLTRQARALRDRLWRRLMDAPSPRLEALVDRAHARTERRLTAYLRGDE